MSNYVTLGRSGLRVSPLCLGTMTFGPRPGFGTDAETAAAIFRQYLDWGGNFIDTADVYTNGESERILGHLIAEGALRDKIVLATKYTINWRAEDPNAVGNGRKNACRAVEASLRRLQTDYIDLYWMHAWDTITPVEEVVYTFDSLIRAGKICYYGFSDVPAWYAARAYSIAEAHGLARPIALQLEYSLSERNIEREHIPMAGDLGLDSVRGAPLGGGLLTGKYQRGAKPDSGRLALPGPGAVDRLGEEAAWDIVDVLTEVASSLDRPPAQVALNRVANRPGTTSVIIGATKAEQNESNLAALDFEIPADLSGRLEAAGRPAIIHPYSFYVSPLADAIGASPGIRRWRA